jgi:hypothetical protein
MPLFAPIFSSRFQHQMSKSFSPRSAQTVAVLAVTQLIGWGTSFDMLGVMGRIIAPDLGWRTR